MFPTAVFVQIKNIYKLVYGYLCDDDDDDDDEFSLSKTNKYGFVFV